MRPFQKLAASCLLISFFAQADNLSPYQSPFGFELERSTLADIQAKFGNAEEFEIPDSHHEFGICYESRDSDAVTVFISGREFGGSDKKLLGVTIRLQNTKSYPCVESNIADSELVVGDLALGLSKEQFEALAAKDKIRANDEYLSIDLEYRRKLTDAERDVFIRRGFGDSTPQAIDVGLGAWGSFENSRAVAIGVWQISTY